MRVLHRSTVKHHLHRWLARSHYLSNLTGGLGWQSGFDRGILDGGLCLSGAPVDVLFLSTKISGTTLASTCNSDILEACQVPRAILSACFCTTSNLS